MAGETIGRIRRGWIAIPGARRSRPMPAWVLLPQLFLAAGWLRAGIANGLTTEWWSGGAVRSFVELDTGHAVTVYEPFLTYVVEPAAVVVAGVVCFAQLSIAVLLFVNRRVLGALLAAAFLNVHFMLAGAVNPSAFYLVIAMVIALWQWEYGAPEATTRTIARRAALVAVVTTLALSPFVTTVHPAEVIEDPAIVLIFLSVLLAGTSRWAHRDGALHRR